ncbi:MAG TPA: EscU/YscU/HrcU family type III secretion system export apparatus switch protein, partial [Bacillota bacterium]|nr:EscU/YscU/HrcU family type III secretion system export apparatus switch protein [Bacillota bacterium]
MAKPSHEDRTEQPTPRRREEARKEGQVARSADLNAALGLIVGLMILESSFSFLGQTVVNFMVTGIG